MLRNLVRTIAVTAMAAGSVLLSAGGASAAHCTGGTDLPGFSYFGTEHVQETSGNQGINNPEGDPQGASVCRANTGSPSERAPGQNR